MQSIQTSLNWDILIATISCGQLTRKDLLSAIVTCRTLYRTCAHLTLEYPINLCPPRHQHHMPALTSFCSFVLKEKRRALHIHDLRIGFKDLRGYNAETITNVHKGLANIIRQAQNIQVLNIENADALLALHSHLAPAISSLRKLEQIVITGIGERTVEMFAAMESPVVSADITYVNDYRPPPGSLVPDEADPIALLAPFSATLESLQVTSTVIPFVVRDTEAQPVALFPRVLSLQIETCYNEGSLNLFMRALPAVSEVVFWDTLHSDDPIADQLEDADETRMNNLPIAVNHWPALDILNTSIALCYVTAIQSRTRFWTLDRLSPENKPHFQICIEAMHPTTLQLCTNAQDLQADDASDLFPVSTVKELDLTLNLDEGDPSQLGLVMVRG